MGLLRPPGPPALKAPASFFCSPAELEEEGTLTLEAQQPLCARCLNSGTCTDVLPPLWELSSWWIRVPDPTSPQLPLSRSTVPCPAGNFLPCRQDHQHREPQTYFFVLRNWLWSVVHCGDNDSILCAGVTDGAPPPPQGCHYQTAALQGPGLLSADAARLTCGGVHQGEFSGVCCCAMGAFFLALCPSGRLCAHPPSHCHLCQSDLAAQREGPAHVWEGRSGYLW